MGPCLKADTKCALAFKKLGITDVALSNNHTYDYGSQGLRDTMHALNEVGLPYMGIGENDTDSRTPYIIEQEGIRIGFVNVCEHEYSYALPNRIGANPYNPYATMQDIRNLKGRVDYVIVLYHGGKEMCHYPSPRLRSLCRAMVDNGADVVLMQHSHCIGCYEQYEDGHILYGQGNFHFATGNTSELWCTSLLVSLEMDANLAVKFIPIVSKGVTVDLAKEEEIEKIMLPFYQRNEELKNGEWVKGWHAFCESVKEQYLNAFCLACEDAHETFSHYIDCEAHTDVWKELFPTFHLTNK
jgi:poly-gamma-glutamate synthesis protein (capsule biosynthesis protein)